MSERILFITGKLAEPSVNQVLQEMAPLPFDYRVHQIGVSVAALITDAMIARRLKAEDYQDCDEIIVPGRCRGDLEALGKELGIKITRGPDEIKDLPTHFGRAKKRPDLSRYSVDIFAEIVDAPERTIDSIIDRANYYRDNGADVIDIGCLPQESFPHLEEGIKALHDNGFKVSVDSLSLPDLKRAANAGADYLLSLTEKTIDLAKETDAIPILVPAEPGSLESLERAMETMERWGKPYIADPILDPIHFGLTASIVRYYQLREKYPDIPIMMGVGNLTELTDADTSGINAMLFGIISELNVSCVLATEVSPHARRAIREADVARRMMYAAKQDNSLPRDFTADLLVAHERKPFTDSRDEIIALADNIKDPNYRIKIAADGIYMFNRDGIIRDVDPFEFYPHLEVENDPGHAFYLGVELARAQTAWELGKRYTQDEELQWGCAVSREEDDLSEQKEEGTTMKKTKKQRACGTAETSDTARENMKNIVRDEKAPKIKKRRTACGTAEPDKKKKERPCGTADRKDS